MYFAERATTLTAKLTSMPSKALLCAITVFFWFAQYVYIPFLTPYLFTLSMTATTVGLIVGAYGVTQLVLRIPLGITVDIVRNHKLFIVIGTFLAGASSLGMIILLHRCSCVSQTACPEPPHRRWISFTVLYPAYYEKSEGTKAIGTINLFSNAGRLAAFIVGGILFERIGIRGLFVASFASGMIGSILALFIKREREAAPDQHQHRRPRPGHEREKAPFFLDHERPCTFLVFWHRLLLYDEHGQESGRHRAGAGMLAALFSAAGMVGSYFVGTRTAGKDGGKIPAPARLPAVGGVLRRNRLFPLGDPFLSSPGHCRARQRRACPRRSWHTPSDTSMQDRKSTAMGFYQSVYCLGITLGPVLMGFLVDHASTRASFIVMALIALACAAAIPPVYESNWLARGEKKSAP